MFVVECASIQYERGMTMVKKRIMRGEPDTNDDVSSVPRKMWLLAGTGVGLIGILVAYVVLRYFEFTT
jgi:hypothetical protein